MLIEVTCLNEVSLTPPQSMLKFLHSDTWFYVGMRLYSKVIGSNNDGIKKAHRLSNDIS
jgi:hypothetical protein